MESTSNTAKNGLSNKIKVAIIILTVITLCKLGAVFIKLAYLMSSSEKNIGSYQYLHKVGDKLRNSGLHEQAIHQYLQYLDKGKAGDLSRSKISHTVGELYMELSNCQEALVWLFTAEAIDTAYGRTDELKKHIDTCLTQISTPEPKSLTTR